MFDKKDITREQLDFLNPYIEETLKLFEDHNSVEDINEDFISTLQDIHMRVIDKANENIENNKLKFGIKGVGLNPYGRIKVEKLPVPNLYSVIIFSNLWVSKFLGMYIDQFISDVPEGSVNEDGNIDKDLVFYKLLALLGGYADFFFSDRQGRKKLKDWVEYTKVPLGGKTPIIASFFLFPEGLISTFEELYQGITEKIDNEIRPESN